jgi:hypothetical protein
VVRMAESEWQSQLQAVAALLASALHSSLVLQSCSPL